MSNVSLFSPSGTFLYAAINGLGSFHDAAVPREQHQKLRHHTEEGYWFVGDFAFPTSNGHDDKTKTPLKSNFRAWPDNTDPSERANISRTDRQLVSAR
ncbi:hypothetical protein POJ06DRAFT_266383 [Lipomyces tetrasporus]|uniref:DDE Tnp4 domain-containing protein n=1 Tax=Lipomyces tetrasporus TaxID=54092 RepID=A0AAD7VT42_9ASCO|nr:uncharacterized protein POJ06DRAFT_266383 [Lipomyces tetrasporus]KAJ8101767.1 hypothetical protein POJ06DRAFT_266383 [Lipomyces tetrasporus]